MKCLDFFRRIIINHEKEREQDCIIKAICCLKELNLTDEKIIMLCEKYYNLRRSSIHHLIAEAEEFMN